MEKYSDDRFQVFYYRLRRLRFGGQQDEACRPLPHDLYGNCLHGNGLGIHECYLGLIRLYLACSLERCNLHGNHQICLIVLAVAVFDLAVAVELVGYHFRPIRNRLGKHCWNGNLFGLVTN
jgi:hypothetical protein